MSCIQQPRSSTEGAGRAAEGRVVRAYYDLLVTKRRIIALLGTIFCMFEV